MNYHERRRYDMFVGVREFGQRNAADFPAKSVGAVQFAEVAAVIDLLDELGAAQTGGAGDASLGFANKDTARENVREAVGEIARTARSMRYEIDGVSDKFKMPRSVNDQTLLAAARSFAADAAVYQKQFIAYGLPDDFLSELQIDVAAFEAALGAPDAGRLTQTNATAGIGTAVRRGMTAVRILDGVVKNKYRGSAGNLAAWTGASHIARAARTAPTVKPPA